MCDESTKPVQNETCNTDACQARCVELVSWLGMLGVSLASSAVSFIQRIATSGHTPVPAQ